MQSPGWMGSWVFAYHSAAAKHVHQEGVSKHKGKHLVNARNLYRGYVHIKKLVFLIEDSKYKSSMPIHSHLNQL